MMRCVRVCNLLKCAHVRACVRMCVRSDCGCIPQWARALRQCMCQIAVVCSPPLASTVVQGHGCAGPRRLPSQPTPRSVHRQASCSLTCSGRHAATKQQSSPFGAPHLLPPHPHPPCCPA